MEKDGPGALPAQPDVEMEGAGGESPPPSEELLAAVQKRLEELLSREGLAEDLIVQQSINAQMAVPTMVLAGHPKVAELGSSVTNEVILAAAGRSTLLAATEGGSMVRPTHLKAKRNIVLLRDLPADATEQELRDLLAPSDQADNVAEVRLDVNSTAYITFDSDEAAHGAALWLRSQHLRGEPVRCAMKSGHFLRSFFPAAPSMASTPNCSFPASPWMGPPSARPSPGPPSFEASPLMWTHQASWDSGTEASGGGKKGKKGKGKGKGKYGGATDMEAAMDAQMRLEQAIGGTFPSAELDSVPVGYKHGFAKYTKQQIVDICGRMESVGKPEGFAKFEKDHKDAALFNAGAQKGWAPPPAPVPCSPSLGPADGGAARRVPSCKEGYEEGGVGDASDRQRSRTRKRADTHGSAWSRARSEDWSEWDWQQPGGSWWAGAKEEGGAKGGGKSCGKGGSRRGNQWGSEWSGEWSGEWSASQQAAWVQKGQKKVAQEAGGAGELAPAKAPREQRRPSAAGDGPPATAVAEQKPSGKLSWAEKVKGLQQNSAAAPQKWVMKAKPSSDHSGSPGGQAGS